MMKDLTTSQRIALALIQMPGALEKNQPAKQQRLRIFWIIRFLLRDLGEE